MSSRSVENANAKEEADAAQPDAGGLPGVRVILLHQGDKSAKENVMVNHACEEKEQLQQALLACGHTVIPLLLDDEHRWISTIKNLGADLVFNAADLGPGLDITLEPHIAAVLDIIKIPYTGASMFAGCLSGDKLISKRYLQNHRVPVPSCTAPGESEFGMNFPAIVKYRKIHNSEGITQDSIVHDAQQMAQQFERMRGLKNEEIIAEEFIDGEEICAGFVGNGPHMMVLPPAMIQIPHNQESGYRIRDFATKWADTDGEGIVRAELPRDLDAELASHVRKIAELFSIADYARIDFRVRQEGRRLVPYAIDINTNPDISVGATLPMMAGFAGITHTQLIGRIVDAALRRHGLFDR